MKRITPRIKGRLVIFHGFDGLKYTAHIENVRNGVAKLLYQAQTPQGKMWATAYVQDPARIT